VWRSGLLILAFSGGEALYGAHLRSAGGAWRPDPAAIAVAAVVCFLFFLQLRIADEHKDNVDDTRWRPERPVPRGLVTLAELRRVAVAAAAVQAGVTALYQWTLLPVLLAVWGFMALMSVEFFAPAFLRARPILYLVSHMLVIPLIAWFAVSCGLHAPGSARAGAGLAAFLTLALCNGVMLEIGRKTWAPASEREGVESYSRLWGPQRAALCVAAAGALGTLAALTAERLTGAGVLSAVVAVAGLGALLTTLFVFHHRMTPSAAGRVEAATGLAALTSYIGVAWLPAAAWVLAA
jgi:4-hydroxybenzoate polyprenyltransferase